MSDRAPQTKAARQARIEDLLRGAQIRSQSELAERLASEGFGVTQGTLSRDLVDVGAIRVRTRDGDLVYALGGEEPSAGSHRLTKLAQVCGEILVSAEASANLVIVKTPPGAAQYLASALDKSGLTDVLGTIAGDDTILLVSRDPDGGRALAARLLGLSERFDKS